MGLVARVSRFGRRLWRFGLASGPTLPLALFSVLGPLLGALVLVATHATWLGFLRDLHPAAAAAFFIIVAVPLLGLSLAPTHIASLCGGMLFGALTGTGAAMAAILLAALFGFEVLKRLVGDRVERQLAGDRRSRAIHEALTRGGLRRTAVLVALLRLSPVMPFAGTNLVMAAARVPRGDFLVGSFFGLAPRIAAVAVAGAGLDDLDLDRAEDLRLALLGLLATLAALWCIGRMARRGLALALGDQAA